MNIKFTAAIGVLIAATLPAHSFELVGGEAQLSYSAFEEDTDVSKLALEGSVEAGFAPSFGLQLDLGHQEFNLSDADAQNATLHAIYHLNEATSFGAFYGQERVEGDSLDLYGIEAAHDYGMFGVEAYLARAEDGSSNADLAGIGADYALNETLSIGATFDYLDFDGDGTAHRTALRTTYASTPNTEVYAEIGNFHADAAGTSGSEVFVGIGARVLFGANRGVTFDQRGVTRQVPGL